MVNIATGLSLGGGDIKIIIYSIGNFPTLRCLEQIRNNICYHKISVLVVANGVGFSYGQLGMSHHATEDFGIMRSLPNIDILSPCSESDAYNLTADWLISNSGPAYLRLDKSTYNENNFYRSEDFSDFKIIRGTKKNNDILEVFHGGISSVLNNKDLDYDCCLVHRVRKGTSQAMVSLLDKYKEIIVYEEQNQDAGFCQYIAWHCTQGKIKNELRAKCIPNILPSFVGDQFYMRDQLEINK